MSPGGPKETLIYSIHGTNQLAAQEVRLLDRSIFNDLHSSRNGGTSLCRKKREKISVSLRDRRMHARQDVLRPL
jgi:hypothetical protein